MVVFLLKRFNIDNEMRLIPPILCFLYVLIFASACSSGKLNRTDNPKMQNDSIVSPKDNLNLMLEQLYLITKGYRFGVTQYDKDVEKPELDPEEKQELDRLLKMEGFHRNHLIYKEQDPIPVIIIQNDEKRVIYLGDEELNDFPANSIASIELIYSEALANAMYGLRSVACGIVIQLYPNDEK